MRCTPPGTALSAFSTITGSCTDMRSWNQALFTPPSRLKVMRTPSRLSGAGCHSGWVRVWESMISTISWASSSGAQSSNSSIGRRTSALSTGSCRSSIRLNSSWPSRLRFSASQMIRVARYAPSSRKPFSRKAAWPLVSMARGQSMPSPFSRMASSITLR